MKVFSFSFLTLIFLLNGNTKSSSFINPDINVLSVCIHDAPCPELSLVSNKVKDSLQKTPEKSVQNIVIKTLTGFASFYSKGLEGAKTATGEIFRHAYYTAASNNFPLNTWLRVTNIKNSKSVIVRINDRMHPRMAEKGRVVDLTSSAAKAIGLTYNTGIAKVNVEVVKKGTID